MSRIAGSTLWTVAVVAAASLCALQGAWAERATAVLDPLADEAGDRLVALDGDDSGSARKGRKAAEKAIGVAARDSATLAADLADMKKLIRLLGKRFRDVESVDRAFVQAIDAGLLQVDRELREARGILDRAADSKATRKGTKKADAAGKLLARVRQEETAPTKRAAFLLRAQKAAVKARAQADRADPPLVHRELAPTGGVRGFVLTAEEATVIAESPQGGTAIAGAELVFLARDGTELGRTTSGADGAFDRDGLPPGTVRIAALLPAKDFDAEVSVTVVPGVSVAAGGTPTVGRAAANALALAGVPDTAFVWGTVTPLPADTTIEPYATARPGSLPRASDRTTLSAATWFFFVDLHPFSGASHPVEYVFVDADTGAVVRRDFQHLPLVNGAHLWRGYDDVLLYSQDPGTIFPPDFPAGLTLTHAPDVVQFPVVPTGQGSPLLADLDSPIDEATRDAIFTIEPSGDAPKAAPNPSAGDAFNNKGSDGVFAILVKTAHPTHRTQDLDRMATALVFAGVPIDNIAKADLTQVQTPVVDPAGLDDLEVLAKQRRIASAILEQVFLHFEDRIQQRLQQGEHSTLIVYLTGTGSGDTMDIGFDGPGRWMLQPWQLKLRYTSACRVRVLLETSFAEKFQEGLEAELAGTRHDLAVYAASGRDAVSTHNPAWTQYSGLDVAASGSHFTMRAAEAVRIEDGDLAGLATGGAGSPFVASIAALPAAPPVPFVREDVPPWCGGRPDSGGDPDGEYEFPAPGTAKLTVDGNVLEFPFVQTAFVGVNSEQSMYDFFFVFSENAQNTAGVVVLNLFRANLPVTLEDGAYRAVFSELTGLSSDHFKYDPTGGGSEDALFHGGAFGGVIRLDEDVSTVVESQTFEGRVHLTIFGSRLVDVDGVGGPSFKFEASMEGEFFKPPQP